MKERLEWIDAQMCQQEKEDEQEHENLDEAQKDLKEARKDLEEIEKMLEQTKKKQKAVLRRIEELEAKTKIMTPNRFMR